MKPSTYPWDIPDVILLIGTDASGKDHVANVLINLIRESGGEVEKRQRFFSGKATNAVSSENKGRFDTFQEKAFLGLFKYLGFLMPLILSMVIVWDLRRFRLPDDKKLVLVGHNCLRGLAFHLAHVFSSIDQIRLPWYLKRTLEKLQSTTNVHVIVLDVEDYIRKQRIAERMSRGTEDEFDRYMHRDGERSEHIEACLVHLARQYLDGKLIENNDLSADELQRILQGGFPDLA